MNRWLPASGIPLVVVALILVAPASWIGACRGVAALFAAGWLLQCIGQAVDGTPTAFLEEWRVLPVSARWWVAKVPGRA